MCRSQKNLRQSRNSVPFRAVWHCLSGFLTRTKSWLQKCSRIYGCRQSCTYQSTSLSQPQQHKRPPCSTFSIFVSTYLKPAETQASNMRIWEYLSTIGAAAVFTILISYNIFAGQSIATLSYLLYAIVWAYLTCLTVDGEATFLPTREAFLNDLRHVPVNELPPDHRECSICYDVPKFMARLPCGHAFCVDCIARIFPADTTDFRCPFCRRALFRMQAPWDTIVVKLFICVTVEALIEHVMVAGRSLRRATDCELGWWTAVDVALSCWNVYDTLRRLKFFCESLNRNGLVVWEGFSWWGWWLVVPLDVWRLLTSPWAIEELVLSMLG